MIHNRPIVDFVVSSKTSRDPIKYVQKRVEANNGADRLSLMKNSYHHTRRSHPITQTQEMFDVPENRKRLQL